MKNKTSMRFIGSVLGGALSILLLVIIIFIWLPAHHSTKHLTVMHPIIEVHGTQEIIFDLLKGSYLLRIGGKELFEEDIAFPFSVSGTIVTSSENVHFERSYLPPNDHDVEPGHVSISFHIKENGKVTIVFDVSLPEEEQLYLHLHGII